MTHEDTPSSPKGRRRGRLLVIDDEVAIGRTLAIGLSDEHDVVTAASGRQALAILESDERWDLVLCDLKMPDVSGIDVYEQVRATRPALADRFVFLTGGAFTTRARDFLDATSVPRIEKPFDLPSVAAMVRERIR